MVFALFDCNSITGCILILFRIRRYHMKNINRIKNKFIARLASSFPALAKHLIASYTPLESADIPWMPVKKKLSKSKIALVTTAGIHHGYQKPFNMDDPTGDASFRIIDTKTIERDYVITHDYYDHRDADKDLNIIFPLTRLKEMAGVRIIGSVAKQHFSFKIGRASCRERV